MNSGKLKSIIKLTKTCFLFAAFIWLNSCSFSKYSLDQYKTENELKRKQLFRHEVCKLNLADGDTLVDIGCSLGYHDFQLFHFYPNKYFVLEDVFNKKSEVIKKGYILVNDQKRFFRKQVKRVLGTDTTIPLSSNRYKTLLCRMTLHEFTKPLVMINEMKRIMAPDGILIVEEINPIQENEVDRGCKMRHMTKNEIVTLMNQGGLTLVAADISTWPIDKPEDRNFNILTFKK
jgi:ubiquinone/menaquinone biosynthesis C-methylase UbiE